MRITKISITIMLILCIMSAVFAAATATLTVPSDGEYYYWFSYKDINSKQTVTVPRKFTGKTITVELPMIKDQVAESKLYVYDCRTGNEAIHSVKAKSSESTKIEMRSSDFSFIRRVGINITSSIDGKNAASAIVTLKVGDTVQRQIIDPSSSGVAYFEDVPSGTVKIIVEYGLGKSSTQDIDIPLERKELVPIIKVPVVGQIDTLSETQKSGAGTSPSVGAPDAGSRSKTKASTSTQRNISPGTALFGIVLLAIVVYLAYRFLRNKGADVKSMLKSAGIDLPEETNQPQGAQSSTQTPVDPTICPYCGTKKDPITGACACTVAGPGAVVTSGILLPRLVVNMGPYMGTIFSIEKDVVTIGRDESNDICLSSDNTVSRRHAKITKTGGSYAIIDEGSSNGTFVNGVRVTNAALHSGDEIQVGNTRFRFEI